MTWTFAIDAALVLLILAVAVWTIAARDTFAAVVGFVAYGLLLALVWVRLHAVDVALTEAAIGSGLSGVLLIGAAARLRSTEAKARRGASERCNTRRCRALCSGCRDWARSRRSFVAGSCTHASPPRRRQISLRPVSATR